MSKIFQALERAERERSHRGQRNVELQGKRSAGEASQPPLVVVPSQPPTQHLSIELESDPDIVKKGLAGVDSHLVSLLDPAAIESEQYRMICYNIERIRREKGVSILGITSSALGDGKTTIALNVVVTLAQSPDVRVLLIDLDFRRPAVMQRLGLTRYKGPGFGELIAKPSLSFTEVVQRHAGLNFGLLSTGKYSVLPHDILNSPRVGEILQEARQQYDYVLVDLPPILPAFDSQSLERWIDGFVFVVSADKTTRKLIEEGLRIIDQTKLIGLIFNNYKSPAFGYSSYYTYNDASSAQTGWIARMKKFMPSFHHPLRK